MCGRLPQNSLVCSRCREHTRFLRIHWIYFTCPVRERLVWRGESPSAPKEPAGNWAGTLGSVYQNLVQSQSAAEESLKRRFSPSLPVLFVEFTAFLTEPSWSLAHSNKAAPRWYPCPPQDDTSDTVCVTQRSGGEENFVLFLFLRVKKKQQQPAVSEDLQTSWDAWVMCAERKYRELLDSFLIILNNTQIQFHFQSSLHPFPVMSHPGPFSFS